VTGTPSSAGAVFFYQESTTGVAAVQGQTWTNSAGLSLSAGTGAGLTSANLGQDERIAGGGGAGAGSNGTTAALSSASQRLSCTRTLTAAATAFVLPYVQLNLSGAAVDFTLDIQLPQLERSPVATTALANAPGIYTAPAGTPTGNYVSTVGSNGAALANGWAVSVAAGLTTTVLGQGNETLSDGTVVDYTEVQISGTTNSTFYVLRQGGGVPAIAGTSYCASAYVRQTGGALTNITATQYGFGGNPTITPNFTLGATYSRPFGAGVQTADGNMDPRFLLTFASGAAINITVRIASPQFEPGDRPNKVVRNPTGTPILSSYSGPVSAGLLVETSATNSIRNNSMQGAVVGSPGTLPTNWNRNTAGISSSIVGIGIEAGIDYVDIRFSGTSVTAGGTTIYGNAEPNGSVAAAPGQTWHCVAVHEAGRGWPHNIAGAVVMGCIGWQADAVTSTASVQVNVTPTSKLTRYDTQVTNLPALTAFIQAALAIAGRRPPLQPSWTSPSASAGRS
jgi:hypothetical protein